eukprot:gene5637-9453_t
MEVITEEPTASHKLSTGSPHILIEPDQSKPEIPNESLQPPETDNERLSLHLSSTRSSFESTEENIIDEKEYGYQIDSTITSNPTVDQFVLISTVQKGEKKGVYEVKRTLSEFEWLYKTLVHNIPSIIIPSVPPRAILEHYVVRKDKLDKRNLGGKLMENFIENCLRFPKIFNSTIFLNFLTLKDKNKFEEYIQKHSIPTQSLYFSWRKMGKKAPTDDKYSTGELLKYYRDLKPHLFHTIKSSGELIYNQMRLSKESLSIVNDIKMIGELDQNLKEDCDDLASKIKENCNITDKIYFENQNIPLMDEISYVSLQMEQIVHFMEEKDNKHIELDLYRTDYDTLSRKQEKLRLSPKTKPKAELMDQEVNKAEKLYKQTKKNIDFKMINQNSSQEV